MHIVCLDLEGVLVPEIWIAFAEKTGIAELRTTTREVPDYDLLMHGRIKILKAHGYTLKDIQDVVATIKPLEGAKEFLDELRTKCQVVILSDTFEEYVSPLMAQLGYPTILCNSFVIDKNNFIQDINMRQEEGKLHAIEAFRSLNCKTFAAGDSYNDLKMIKAADSGCLFRAPENILKEYPELPLVTDYKAFMAVIDKFLAL